MVKILASQLREKVQVLEEEIKTKDEAFKIRENELNDRIKDLEQEVKGKQEQLDKKELKKLAQAFGDQEEEFKKGGIIWGILIIFSALALSGSILLSAYLAGDKIWYEKLPYYLVNFVFLTLFIFSLRQYSHNRTLRIDFANRKTLAQSYSNIISSGEDDSIKIKFIEKATDVLAAKTDLQNESFTILEKGFDAFIEVAKNLSKKSLP